MTVWNVDQTTRQHTMKTYNILLVLDFGLGLGLDSGLGLDLRDDDEDDDGSIMINLLTETYRSSWTPAAFSCFLVLWGDDTDTLFLVRFPSSALLMVLCMIMYDNIINSTMTNQLTQARTRQKMVGVVAACLSCCFLVPITIHVVVCAITVTCPLM